MKMKINLDLILWYVHGPFQLSFKLEEADSFIGSISYNSIEDNKLSKV